MVTGPQRSGTTITAKIIAKELDFQYLDEREIHVDNFDKLFKIYQRNKFVLQAPGLCAYAHMMPGAVVLVRRNIEEIIASQERIQWSKRPQRRELNKYFESEGVIAKIKYDTWDNWQSDRANLFEIDYTSIADHPMYVEDRKDFKPKQTAI
jgi:hypothetical protein